jgi:two-component system, LuxR family, response regulator FixJ
VEIITEPRTIILASSPTIAVVEDDESMRQAFTELFEVFALPCRTFDQAEAFLAAYESDAFSCLITDVRLPGISGLELLQRLKALGSSIPVIVVTSLTDAITHSRAMNHGAFAYLTKPVKDEELMHHVAAAIDRKDPSIEKEP